MCFGGNESGIQSIYPTAFTGIYQITFLDTAGNSGDTNEINLSLSGSYFPLQNEGIFPVIRIPDIWDFGRGRYIFHVK